MKDFAQCGHCPYRKCKDNGYYDCDIDKVLRGATHSAYSHTAHHTHDEQPPDCSRYILSSDGDFVCDCGIVIERQLPPTLTSRPATHEPHGVCPDSVKICPEVDCDKCREADAQAREDVLEKLRTAIGERTWVDSDGDLHEGTLTMQEIEESLRNGGDE